jgi:prepilin-type processing-associated H-X9-DG protein
MNRHPDGQSSDYASLIDRRRHARSRGMNMLFLDLHVSVEEPTYRFPGQLDPWDLPDR